MNLYESIKVNKIDKNKVIKNKAIPANNQYNVEAENDNEKKLDIVQELANKFVEYLRQHDVYAELDDYSIAENQRTNDVYGVIDYSISWGDWKHDHLYSEDLAKEFFKEDLSISEDVTEEDGSDTYSATHEFLFNLAPYLGEEIKDNEEIKESSSNYFQLFQNEEQIDVDEWNNSNQEERDAMVEPQVRAFWNKYKNEMTDADINKLLDDMEDNNWHTECSILTDIVNAERSAKNRNAEEIKEGEGLSMNMNDPDFEETVKRDFKLYLYDKYKDENYKDVTEDDINEYFTGMFYDIVDNDDLDTSNAAEEIIRKEYGFEDEELNEADRQLATVKDIDKILKMSNKELDDFDRTHSYENSDLAEYVRCKLLYAETGLAKHKECYEKALNSLKNNKLKEADDNKLNENAVLDGLDLYVIHDAKSAETEEDINSYLGNYPKVKGVIIKVGDKHSDGIWDIDIISTEDKLKDYLVNTLNYYTDEEINDEYRNIIEPYYNSLLGIEYSEIRNSLNEADREENGYVDIDLGFQYDVNSLDELPPEADVRDEYKNIKCSIPKKNVLRITGPKSILKKIIKNNEFEEGKPAIKELNESSTEERWNATELDREGFYALLKFNNPEEHLNPSLKYIITRDGNEVYRFAMSGTNEKIKDTGAKIEFRNFLKSKNNEEIEEAEEIKEDDKNARFVKNTLNRVALDKISNAIVNIEDAVSLIHDNDEAKTKIKSIVEELENYLSLDDKGKPKA